MKVLHRTPTFGLDVQIMTLENARMISLCHPGTLSCASRCFNFSVIFLPPWIFRFGKEFLGPCPGGVCIGNGRGRKLNYFLEIKKIRNEKTLRQKFLKRNSGVRIPAAWARARVATGN